MPAVLHSLSNDAPRDRLTFAKWLVDARNPLVGRVIANQLWQSFFGRGIVSTPENFGVQGEPPSHPALLDWLAVEFQYGGWSLKSLQRQIVMSAVYRQSSKVSPELAERDPRNILLAHGPRFRVEAETIRDIALEASGLLHRTLGGPSVFPPQPGEAGATFGPFRWKDSTGADRYRRGLYTFRKRGGPYAAFATFDAPPPNTCAMSRRRSNTPLQALAQLNDLAILEASRALAGRVLREGTEDTTAPRSPRVPPGVDAAALNIRTGRARRVPRASTPAIRRGLPRPGRGLRFRSRGRRRRAAIARRDDDPRPTPSQPR